MNEDEMEIAERCHTDSCDHLASDLVNELHERAARWRDDGTMTQGEFAAVMAVLYVRDVRAASPEAQARLLAVVDQLVCAFPGCGQMIDSARHRFLVQECLHEHRLDCHSFIPQGAPS